MPGTRITYGLGTGIKVRDMGLSFQAIPEKCFFGKRGSKWKVSAEGYPAIPISLCMKLQTEPTPTLRPWFKNVTVPFLFFLCFSRSKYLLISLM